ncbi:sterol regulatory element binding protein cleavage-activating protein [Phanerochaete sordida]|uniref:Sterol regulatory element-binding protein cleavage-activating protein n=1 Tax=Phanerochaete sordida TaxID=48140 RepID=A0A9P3G461_9APHY|nr:sterol regulatory element binding protein cleavage-activating protein [Phanerochaete sordida]
MSPLQRVRNFGIWFFRRFGVHCATHQIRVILISSVVISCLLFPAVTVYSSTKAESFSLSLSVFDAFRTPDDLSNYFAVDRIRQLWEGKDSLRVRDDSIARARCGKGGVVRVERILVHDVDETEDTYHVLSHRSLLSTLNLERRLSEVLASQKVSCIRSPHGRCLVLSPLAFWDYEEDLLLRDADVLSTLGPYKNTSTHGLTITTDMVLAGRDDGEEYEEVANPVLTYFFPESDCLSNSGHNLWLNIVEDAAASLQGETVVLSQQPHLLALEYEKEPTPSPHPSVLSAFTYTAYFIFLVYFWRSIKRMNTVHSRIGLAFTGIVEIIVSTITSLSVCALVGFRITMVPWEIFPIVVIFIGVENMFSIVDAVVKTSIALPVKERIAEGLGYAGTSNSLKLCSYNSVLGVIAFFSTGAIRQFCAFAIVVLVAHWFLVHTFFVTVLSIDIQRLELDELLRQGANFAPTLVPEPTKTSAKAPRTKLGRLASRIQRALRGRPTKNISLVLLLGVTATLYYMTRTRTSRLEPMASLPRNRFRVPKPQSLEGISPAENIWRTFNPVNYDLVHIRVEAPTIIIMQHDANANDTTYDRPQHRLEHDRMHRSRWSRLWWRTARPLEWAFKVIMAPTFVTTSLLYGLLLYLLKDAELLEAQRNRKEPDSPSEEELTPAVDSSITFQALPRAFATDVDLLASSKDGNIVVSVGLQNEFVLWRKDTKTRVALDPTDVLLGSSGSTPSVSSALTAVAVNDRGTHVAAGTAAGVIGVWHIAPNRVVPLPHLATESACAVAQIAFASGSPHSTGMSTPRKASGGRPVDPVEYAGSLYATYENAIAIRWTVGSLAAPTYVRPSKSASVIKSMLLSVQPSNALLVGFVLEDGTLELCDVDGATLLPRECCIAAGNPSDLVAQVHVCSMELEGQARIVVGAATQAGVVSLWDAATGECMYILDDPYGAIGQLRLVPVRTKRCATCRELPVESFALCFSVGSTVLVHRAYLSLPTRRCSCPSNQPRVMSSIQARKTRSGSTASLGPSSGTSSPVHPRARIPSFSGAPAFDAPAMYPVSAHGVHSRRASDKRSLETFIPIEADEQADARPPVGPQDPSAGAPPGYLRTPGAQRSSLWENLLVSRTAEAPCERGAWDVAAGLVVGLRRRPRMALVGGGTRRGGRGAPGALPRADNRGLTPATLERWELWTFDPASATLRASPLLALDAETRAAGRQQAARGAGDAGTRRRVSLEPVPRLHFTRVAPLVCTRTHALAGFGNTVGVVDLAGGARPRPSLERIRRNSG